jgi:uncharacterized protein YoxC
MMIFLVIVSIAFNMIAFLFIVILFLRQNKLIKMEENIKKPINEMEDLMSTYLLQMKDENERFIQSVKDINNANNHINPSSAKISDIKQEQEKEIEFQPFKNKEDFQETQSDLLNSPESFSTLIGKTISNRAIKAYQNQNSKTNRIDIKNKTTTPLEIDKENIEDLIITLQKQGHTLEEIAKRLNVGKTEIELYLRFYEKTKE